MLDSLKTETMKYKWLKSRVENEREKNVYM